jgi:hypothetical protein
VRSAAFAAFAALAAACFPRPAEAGAGAEASVIVAHIFAFADLDESGSLDREEYAAAGLEKFGVSFEASDADGSGETSAAEYLALYERHHPAPGSGS